MINSPSCYIETLTNDSLYGFVIELSVSKEDSEYYNLDITQFTKPVTHFIIKMVVLTSTNDRPLKDFNGRSKNSMSRQKLFEEAKTQQYIWRETILSGREEICPSIAAFSLLDNSEASRFLSFIVKRNRLSSFDYMEKLFMKQDQYGLGLILMPKIDSYTFSHVSSSVTREENKLSQTVLEKTYSQIISKVVQLFIEEGIIHFDLHTRNILVSYSHQVPRVTIIDFGRITFCQSNEEDYLTPGEKKTYRVREVKKEFYDFYKSHFDSAPSADVTRDGFPSMEGSPSKDPHKQIQFIDNVMEYLVALGIEIGHINHAKSKRYKEDPNMYQMIWYDDVRRHENKDMILYQAFQYLKRHMYQQPLQKKELSRAILEKFERDGLILEFSGTYKKFQEEIPVNLSSELKNNKSVGSVPGVKSKEYWSHTPPPRPDRIPTPTSSTPIIARNVGTAIAPTSSTPVIYRTPERKKKTSVPRCKKGFKRYPPKTGKCLQNMNITIKQPRKPRCKKGTRRHPNGNCVPIVV